jgi:intracellular multiplication protein IcmP
MVGKYMRFPFAAILGFFAILLYKANATNNYRKTYTMKSLQKQEQENWPQISPTTQLNLVTESIDEGKWAMALTPMQFAKQHKLVKEEKKHSEVGILKKAQQIIPTVIESKANSLFVQQLGRPWSNVKALKKHAQALFAVFAARANGDRDIAQKILWQLAASSTGRLNYHGVDTLLKKHMDSKVVQIVINQHAYENTVMAGMLELARTDGVLASAEFIWLKPYDRHLWFILNTVGRQTAPPEIAGVYAHWISEKAVGRRMVIPMISEATKALQVALNEIIYKPDNKEAK